MHNAAQSPQTAMDPLAFEPIQLNEKLAFLACYSHYIIALQSDQQDQQAADLYRASREVCPVILLGARDLPQFPAEQYASLAQAFGLQTDAPEKALGQFVESETARPLVILTGCESMDARQLASMCGLASRLGLGLTLFSRTNLTRKIDPALGNVLHTTVRKLDSRDIKQLLYRRAQPEVRLSDSDLQTVVEKSRGNLNKADSLLTEMMSREQKNLGLPLAHMSMLILFLGLVVGGFLMIPSDDVVTTEVVVQPKNSESINRISTKAPDTTRLTEVTQGISNTAASGNTLAAGHSTEKLAPAPVSDTQRVAEPRNQVTEPEPNSLSEQQTPVASTPPPIVLDSVDPNAWINDLPATAAGSSAPVRTSTLSSPAAVRDDAAYGSTQNPGQSQGEWLLSADPSAYTLQIMGSHDESRIRAFMASHPYHDEFGYFETRHLNQPWFVLTYGRYPNRDAAVTAIDGLSARLKAQKPWARGVKTVRGG